MHEAAPGELEQIEKLRFRAGGIDLPTQLWMKDKSLGFVAIQETLYEAEVLQIAVMFFKVKA